MAVIDTGLDAIIEQREIAVRGILEVCKSTLDKYSTSQVQCCHRPKTEHCDNIVLASLFKAFNKMGIMAFEHTKVVDLSLERLVKELEDIKIRHLTCEGIGGVTKETKHSETCDPVKQMLLDVAVVMKGIMPLRLDSFGRAELAMSWETWETALGVGVSRKT